MSVYCVVLVLRVRPREIANESRLSYTLLYSCTTLVLLYDIYDRTADVRRVRTSAARSENRAGLCAGVYRPNGSVQPIQIL